MGRRSLRDRRILLTGASSGIGRAIALQLASYHPRLMLLARREEALLQLQEELESLGAAEVVTIAGDVIEGEVRAKVLDHIRSGWGGLDLLINNAGISAHGRFVESSPEVLRQILEVNFFAAAELVRAAMLLLAEGSDPVVVNVGSVLGHRGIPYNSEYCASKFALRGWSEAVRPELARHGIGLLLVSPGTVETEFFDHLVAKTDSLPWEKQQGISAEKVAAQILRGIERRRNEIYPNWRGRLLMLLNRFSPRLVDRIMNRYR